MHLSQDHILEVASFISPRDPRPSVSRLEAGGAEIPLTSFLPSAHTVACPGPPAFWEMEKYRRESFLLTSAHEIVPRSHDIDELCIEFICRKKQLIDHIPMVEINVQLLLALFI